MGRYFLMVASWSTCWLPFEGFEMKGSNSHKSCMSPKGLDHKHSSSSCDLSHSINSSIVMNAICFSLLLIPSIIRLNLDLTIADKLSVMWWQGFNIKNKKMCVVQICGNFKINTNYILPLTRQTHSWYTSDDFLTWNGWVRTKWMLKWTGFTALVTYLSRYWLQKWRGEKFE